MKHKTLGYCGIATYVLSVLASATNLRGEATAPTLLLAISSAATVAFMTLAVVRLWRENIYLSATLGASQLALFVLSAMEAVRVPTYGSPLVIITNIVKLIALVSLVWAIAKLFRLRDVPAGTTTGVSIVAQMPNETDRHLTARGLVISTDQPNLTEAHRVLIIWGKYLEYCHDRLRALFIAGIPESLLPYPPAVIEKALNELGKHYHDLGDREGARLIQDAFGPLMLYISDEKALAGAAQKFAMPGLSATIADSLKVVQRNWIKTQT